MKSQQFSESLRGLGGGTQHRVCRVNEERSRVPSAPLSITRAEKARRDSGRKEKKRKKARNESGRRLESTINSAAPIAVASLTSLSLSLSRWLPPILFLLRWSQLRRCDKRTLLPRDARHECQGCARLPRAGEK